jgi:hypothetical protein
LNPASLALGASTASTWHVEQAYCTCHRCSGYSYSRCASSTAELAQEPPTWHLPRMHVYGVGCADFCSV